MATLPNNDISIMLVRNAINCPSTDLGTLCAKAKSGGKGGYAFEIVENGYTQVHGRNIIDSEGLPSSYPYWNIWCNNSPGQWKLVDSPSKPVRFELKRDSSNRYIFSLGGFRGHNTNASVPIMPNIKKTFVRHGTLPINTDIELKANLGDYDWSKISGVNGCQLFVYDGSSIYSRSEVKAITRNSLMSMGKIPLMINTTSTYTKKYTIKMALGTAAGIGTPTVDFNMLGVLPVFGELSITVADASPAYIADVYIENFAHAFRLTNVINENHVNGTYTGLGGISADNRRLVRLRYEKVSDADNSILETINVTSAFKPTERPPMLSVYHVGDTESFYFDQNRMYNSQGTHIVVTFFYE